MLIRLPLEITNRKPQRRRHWIFLLKEFLTGALMLALLIGTWLAAIVILDWLGAITI